MTMRPSGINQIDLIVLGLIEMRFIIDPSKGRFCGRSLKQFPHFVGRERKIAKNLWFSVIQEAVRTKPSILLD